MYSTQPRILARPIRTETNSGANVDYSAHVKTLRRTKIFCTYGIYFRRTTSERPTNFADLFANQPTTRIQPTTTLTQRPSAVRHLIFFLVSTLPSFFYLSSLQTPNKLKGGITVLQLQVLVITFFAVITCLSYYLESNWFT